MEKTKDDLFFQANIQKAKHFKLKKWVRSLLEKMIDNDPTFDIEIDWRDNECLREILVSHEDLAKEIVNQ